MDKVELEKLLNKGENKEIEFKVTKPENSFNYLKTVVAFSNDQGGTIVFGVEDKSLNLVGIPENDLFPMMDSIASAITDGIYPMVIPDISPLTVDGKNLIIVKVASGHERPYRIKSKGLDHGVFVRIAGITKEADEYVIKELMFEGSNRSFETERISNDPLSDEDINKLCILMYSEAKKNADDNQVKNIRPITIMQLLSWGIVRKENDKIIPNNAYGVLVGDEGLPTRIRCACFKGTLPIDFLDSNDFEGFVGERIDQAYKFVLRHINKGFGFAGIHRYDHYEIPPDSLREAIINACVHRSYLDFNDTKVAIFDDRIDIISPGKLAFDQSLEEMKTGRSVLRNKALAQAFAYMNLVESWGAGIPKILSRCAEYGLQEPVLEDKGTYFRLRFLRNKISSPVPSNEQTIPSKGEFIPSSSQTVPSNEQTIPSEHPFVPSEARKLSKAEHDLITKMAKNKEYETALLAKNLNISKRRIRKLLNQLIDKGLVQKIGVNRSTKYILKNNKD